MASLKTTHPALYRAYQFFAALKASLPAWAGGVKGKLTSEDQALVVSILPTAHQQRLFEGMPANDRRHALAVARTLQRADYDQPALLQAALLHDVGKSIGQPLLHRVLIVLLKAFWPAGLHRLSSPEHPDFERASHQPIAPSRIQQINWWRRPFLVHAHHASIGASWAIEAGCKPLAIKLIAYHEDAVAGELSSEAEILLAALRWADNLN